MLAQPPQAGAVLGDAQPPWVDLAVLGKGARREHPGRVPHRRPLHEEGHGGLLDGETAGPTAFRRLFRGQDPEARAALAEALEFDVIALGPGHRASLIANDGEGAADRGATFGGAGDAHVWAPSSEPSARKPSTRAVA